MTDLGFKTIHSHHHHHGWDNSIEPVYRAKSGETITFDVIDASNGNITPDSKADIILECAVETANPTTGPVFIEGAEPGDAVKVTFDQYSPSGWGWTGIFPEFGLLADQFKGPDLRIWKYDDRQALYSDMAKVPVRPFTGTIGTALAEKGRHSVIPPRHVGGNLDIKDLVAGSSIYLPVEVAGALLSIGDTHAAQGDGEVCGTAIESPMSVTVKVELMKGENLKFPRFDIPDNALVSSLRKYTATTGVGPCLLTAAQDAVSGMIDLLTKQQGVNAEDAYMLCSVCGDLKISEIVDLPNYVVSFYFPFSVFE